SISQLIQPQIVQRNVAGSNGIFRATHGFIMESEFVWGATAMMLSEIKYLFNNIDK
ncbi:MAG: hypothetical protein IT220_04090, partial [Flavobacteriaceae bacterium]|nr:hypothetical protein [Flavobacteriaceae bacterium]